MSQSTKICSKCKIDKSLDEFYKDKHNKLGACAHCKVCQKEYLALNKEKISSRNKLYRDNNQDKIIAWRRANKEVRSVLDKEYVKANKEKIRIQRKAYREVNKDLLRSIQKKYYSNNREYLLAQKREYHVINRDKILEDKRVYLQTPMGKAVDTNHRHKRRSQKKGGDVTGAQMLNLISASKSCFYCHCDLNGVKIHVDHFVPLSKGGLHSISNLVIACEPCNLRKGVKDPMVFMGYA